MAKKYEGSMLWFGSKPVLTINNTEDAKEFLVMTLQPEALKAAQKGQVQP